MQQLANLLSVIMKLYLDDAALESRWLDEFESALPLVKKS